MSFGAVMESYRTLRQRVVALAGTNAFPEVSVALPTDPNSELGFLRLTIWAYVLLHERGKVPIRFLVTLAGEQRPQIIEDVQVLRTWVAHNLSLDKEGDQEKIKYAWAWFRRTCGVAIPMNETHWQKCTAALYAPLVDLINACISTAELLDDPTDGPRNVEELKRRLSREWEAYRFDTFVDSAAKRFGYRGLDITALRATRLDAWRKVVRVAMAEEIDSTLTKRIEADVLELMGRGLPYAASEFIGRLRLRSTGELALVMLAVRERAPMDENELGEFLTQLEGALEPLEPTGPA